MTMICMVFSTILHPSSSTVSWHVLESQEMPGKEYGLEKHAREPMGREKFHLPKCFQLDSIVKRHTITMCTDFAFESLALERHGRV